MSKKNKVRCFPTSREAWAFLRDCKAKGVKAGYPSLDKNNAVEYEDKQTLASIDVWT